VDRAVHERGRVSRDLSLATAGPLLPLRPIEAILRNRGESRLAIRSYRSPENTKTPQCGAGAPGEPGIDQFRGRSDLPRKPRSAQAPSLRGNAVFLPKAVPQPAAGALSRLNDEVGAPAVSGGRLLHMAGSHLVVKPRQRPS